MVATGFKGRPGFRLLFCATILRLDRLRLPPFWRDDIGGDREMILVNDFKDRVSTPGWSIRADRPFPFDGESPLGRFAFGEQDRLPHVKFVHPRDLKSLR